MVDCRRCVHYDMSLESGCKLIDPPFPECFSLRNLGVHQAIKSSISPDDATRTLLEYGWRWENNWLTDGDSKVLQAHVVSLWNYYFPKGLPTDPLAG